MSRARQLKDMAFRAAVSPRGKRASRLRELYNEVHKDLRATAARSRHGEIEMFEVQT
jgi:hypothetical protein